MTQSLHPPVPHALSITVRFSCHACGIRDQQVVVRPRAHGEDIVHFLEQVVTPALGETHHMLSPHCHPKRLSDVKIPAPEGGTVGGPTVN